MLIQREAVREMGRIASDRRIKSASFAGRQVGKYTASSNYMVREVSIRVPSHSSLLASDLSTFNGGHRCCPRPSRRALISATKHNSKRFIRQAAVKLECCGHPLPKLHVQLYAQPMRIDGIWTTWICRGRVTRTSGKGASRPFPRKSASMK